MNTTDHIKQPYRLPPYLKSHIRSLLYKYPYTDRYIESRKLFLKTQPIEEDENIGGSRSPFISKPTERIALTLIEDPAIKEMELSRETIKNLLNNSSITTKAFIDGVYFDSRTCSKTTRYAIPITAASVGITDRQGYRIDRDFLNRFALEAGYIDRHGHIMPEIAEKISIMS